MKRAKPWQHKVILENMYLEQRLTLRQIGQILETTAANVLYWMRKFEIKTRKFDLGKATKGCKRTEEEKANISRFMKERLRNKENHPMYGKHHSEQSKRKMSETKRRLHRERQGKSI